MGSLVFGSPGERLPGSGPRHDAPARGQAGSRARWGEKTTRTLCYSYQNYPSVFSSHPAPDDAPSQPRHSFAMGHMGHMPQHQCASRIAVSAAAVNTVSLSAKIQYSRAPTLHVTFCFRGGLPQSLAPGRSEKRLFVDNFAMSMAASAGSGDRNYTSRCDDDNDDGDSDLDGGDIDYDSHDGTGLDAVLCGP